MNFQQKIGAIPSQKIREMIKAGHIKDADEKNIQPASLDLTITDEAYQMKGTFLPRLGETIRDIIKRGVICSVDLTQPLQRDGIYWIKLKEELNLPKDIYAFSSNKSSTGRINLQTRLLSDYVPRFDRIHPRYQNSDSYQGSLWLEVIPRSFLVKLSPGDNLNQLRFFNGQSRLSSDELKNIYSKYQLFFNEDGYSMPEEEVRIRDGDATLIMTVNLNIGEEEIVGYKAIHSNNVLEYQREGYYSAEEFFEPIFTPKDGQLVLKRGEFYLLSAKEFIRVPPSFATEMVAYDISSGEFRTHYAGFFDPGFGYGKEGEVKGTPAVLELRSFDNDFIIRNGQPICKMVYDRLSEIPDLVYGQDSLGSHYAAQRGPRLSKHFRV